MKIKTVSIIGLGALGILYGHHLSKRMPFENLRFVADAKRIARYQSEQVYCNGERCNFRYVAPDEVLGPADLMIFAVKYNSLQSAIVAAKNQIGPQTILLSVLNGIISEEDIAAVYGRDHLLYCVAQGMDAMKYGSQMTYAHMGKLCFGGRETSVIPEHAKVLSEFFTEMEIPHEMDDHMMKRMWGKFMLNVGVNQTVAVIADNYGEIVKAGSARDTLIAAMREVLRLSEKEGIDLTEEDLAYWVKILETLNPEGRPSMRQDVDAKRPSEVELFAGTVVKLGKKHNVSTPVNEMLYNKIKKLESQY
jgi:2-dehydropantoate 2-reductase